MEKTDQLDIARTIRSMHKEKDYHGILALVKGMNPDKIRDRRALEMIADAYDKSGLYKEARENLLIAYERFPASRSTAYKLAIISVKLGNLDDAVDFYEDFCRLAPSDNNRYILKYIIGRAGGIEAKDLIRVLEQYNERESDERWLYELARLYHEVGRADECVALCDEIALWYADGEYEKAALELKFMHKSLSASQQARYEQIMSDFVDEPAPEPEKPDEEEEILLEQEAEVFVSEFSEAPLEKTETIPAGMIEEAVGKDPSVETFRIPVDKVNEVLEQENGAAASDPENITFRLPTDVINDIIEEKNAANRPKSFADTINAVMNEPVKTAPEQVPAAQEEPASEIKTAQQAKPEKETPETKKEETADKVIIPAAVPVPEVKKPAPAPAASGIAAAKLGVSSLKRSSKSYLIKRPSLKGRSSAFMEEPTLRDSVDTSEIPIANERDGQIGINLNLIDKNDKKAIEGQLTIDEFFEHYAGKVARSRDAVAAVEAERLRQIVEAVKDMEPTPLYDMSFNTLEGDEISEEELINDEEELITIVDENDELQNALNAALKEDEPAADPSSGIEEAELGSEELEQIDQETEELPQEEELSAEISEEEDGPEEEIQAPEEETFEELAPEEEASGELMPQEQSSEDAAEEGISDPGFAAALASFGLDAASAAADIPEPGEDTASEPAAAEPDGADMSLEEALARFEQASKAEEACIDDEALMGFGDDLADLVAGGAAPETEEAEETDPAEPATEELSPAKFELSDEFRSEIKEFLLIEGIEDEIKTACASLYERKIAGDPTGGNLIITGDKKCGKTYLAISVIKAVIKAAGSGSGKVVKVQAQPLNGKNISAVFKKVEGRDLIIENVGYLKDETIKDLIAVMKSGEFKQMIVLEGNMLAIENILVHFPEIKDLFASRIDIHELTITQWADIAKRYAKEQGYSIDAMADLALHARIDKINVPNARLGLGDIRDIVDSAIAKASRRNNGKLFAAFSKKNKDEVALTESDFSE